MQRIIIRGDDYNIRQPFCQYTILDTNGNPMNLAGCLILTTFRTVKQSIEADPFDANAVLRHHMQLGADGTITSASGLRLLTTAYDGVVIEGITSAESRLLPTDVVLYNDIQIRDALGETTTYIMDDTSIAIDAYTNRETIA